MAKNVRLRTMTRFIEYGPFDGKFGHVAVPPAPAGWGAG